MTRRRGGRAVRRRAAHPRAQPRVPRPRRGHRRAGVPARGRRGGRRVRDRRRRRRGRRGRGRREPTLGDRRPRAVAADARRRTPRHLPRLLGDVVVCARRAVSQARGRRHAAGLRGRRAARARHAARARLRPRDATPARWPCARPSSWTTRAGSTCLAKPDANRHLAPAELQLRLRRDRPRRPHAAEHEDPLRPRDRRAGRGLLLRPRPAGA